MASHNQHFAVENLEPGAYNDADQDVIKKIESDTPSYEDPFGNEEFAEVKYRTMEWWYVSQWNK